MYNSACGDRTTHKLCVTASHSNHADAKLCQQVVPSDDLEEADSDDSPSPSLLNDELRQEVLSRRAKMHRSGILSGVA